MLYFDDFPVLVLGKHADVVESGSKGCWERTSCGRLGSACAQLFVRAGSAVMRHSRAKSRKAMANARLSGHSGVLGKCMSGDQTAQCSV